MKISPVVGIPTIPNINPTGLSPEKRAAIEALANGKPAPEPEEKEVVQLGEPTTSKTQRITMQTNKTVNRNGDALETQENAPLEPAKQPEVPTVGIPDESVQTKPVAEATRPVSPELAELAKQKRAFQIEREQFDKAKALSGQIPEGYIKAEDLKANALGVLQKHGVTYEQLTNEILGQQSTDGLYAKFEAKIDALTKSIDEKLAAKDSQQEESVYNYMKANVDKMCFSSDAYKLIRETKSQNKVMDLVKKMWNEQGEILDETEAMDLIEAELKEDAQRYAKLLGDYQEKPTQTANEEPQSPQPTPQARTKTLTNKDSARPVMGRRQRAIAAMLGQKTN